MSAINLTRQNERDVTKLFRWQHPFELHRTAAYAQSMLSNEDFLSLGGEYEQKIQEARVGSIFSCGLSRALGPLQVRMAPYCERMLDMELETSFGELCQFEITTAFLPDYKIRLAYRNGKCLEISHRVFSGESVDPQWLAGPIGRKTKKMLRMCSSGEQMERHLLVYQSFSGGAADLKKVMALCGYLDSVWESVWIISGVPHWGGIALLSNRYGFDWPTMEWVSYVNAKEGMGFSGFDIYLQ